MRGKSSEKAGRGGFSLLEVLISAFILSILSVSLIHGLTTLELESRMANDRMGAAMLAADLREEILSRHSVDPDGQIRFGREPGESAAGRISFDDQDDYHGLIDRPPTDIGGTPLSGVNRIWRAVRVESVSPENPAGAALDTNALGLRRFTVTVYRGRISASGAPGSDRGLAELARLTWLGLGQMK